MLRAFLVLSSACLLGAAPPQDPGQPPQEPELAEGKDEAAQAGSTRELAGSIGETVVVATRGERAAFEVPRSVTVADEELLQRRNAIVGLDALNEQMGIWVEKRNGASSDPVIRGFSGANILALVDGNSLTTLWGEGGYAGDDMYGKVDGASIERIEVIRGPASVLYGSNSLGGVINFITKRPPEYTDGAWALGGSLETSFWGTNNGVMLRGETFGADDTLRYRLGYTMRDIGDTRGGGDLGLLEPSGVDESNFDWNSEVRLSDSDTLELNAQYTNRNGLFKYYRPTQSNDTDRMAASLRWRSTDTALGDELSLSVYYQDKEDRRTWLDQEKEGVARWQTYATDLQVKSTPVEEHLLTWGVHYSFDQGESPDDEQFTITTPATGEQKAAPDASWHNLGAYLQDEWQLASDWVLTASARFDFFQYDADDNVFWTIPGSTAPENQPQTAGDTDEETAVTGGLGLTHLLDPDWMVYGSWSRGYRLFPPGFGLRQTGYGVLAPTDGFLDPTTADQLELGTRVRRSWWSLGVAGYYSFLYDVQQPVPGSWNGLTEIDFDGNGVIDPDEQIYVTTGADGYVTGIEIDSAIRLGHFLDGLERWTWHNGIMANYGRVEFDSGDEPLRHTHPPRYLTALRWEDGNPRWQRWFEIVGDFVGRYDEVSEDRLNSDVGYLKDPQDPDSGLIAPYGLPGYIVVHVRAGINLARNVQLTVGIENLFDEEYRTAHSRMDAAGRNLMIGMRASF